MFLLANSEDPDKTPHTVASDLCLHCLPILLANSEDPDQTQHFVASDLGLHCLPISEKWDVGLIWVNGAKSLAGCLKLPCIK